jgi:hypothetical protein
VNPGREPVAVAGAPAAEEHPGQDTREVPLFPELLPHLQAAFDAAEPGTEPVITRYRRLNQNLHTQLRRILWRAGIDTWPRLFQNLRASCDTDLAARFPAHVCARWLGHTPQIAAKHYLQVTDTDFVQAAGLVSDAGRAPLFEADGKAARKAAQSPPAIPCQKLTPDGEQVAETAFGGPWQGVSVSGSDISTELVGATGLEPVTSSL